MLLLRLESQTIERLRGRRGCVLWSGRKWRQLAHVRWQVSHLLPHDTLEFVTTAVALLHMSLQGRKVARDLVVEEFRTVGHFLTVLGFVAICFPFLQLCHLLLEHVLHLFGGYQHRRDGHGEMVGDLAA